MAKRTKPATSARKGRYRARHYIVRLDTFEGDDTACYLLGADPMWIVLSASPTAGAAIIDFGYRSLKEAREAWPDAVTPGPEMRPGGGRAPVGWNRIPPVLSEPWFQDLWKKARRASVRTHGE